MVTNLDVYKEIRRLQLEGMTSQREAAKQLGISRNENFTIFALSLYHLGFPGGSDGKEFTYNAGNLDSIPGWRRSPGEGNGNPLQYSGLENPMNRGAWQATVHGIAKESDTT